jgi:hypothetical protein
MLLFVWCCADCCYFDNPIILNKYKNTDLTTKIGIARRFCKGEIVNLIFLVQSMLMHRKVSNRFENQLPVKWFIKKRAPLRLLLQSGWLL